MSQIHHLLFHGFVLRLHILLLHCQGADNAVIKENEGLGSNTPFCRSSEVPSLTLARRPSGRGSITSVMALLDPRPDKSRRINCMV